MGRDLDRLRRNKSQISPRHEVRDESRPRLQKSFTSQATTRTASTPTSFAAAARYRDHHARRGGVHPKSSADSNDVETEAAILRQSRRSPSESQPAAAANKPDSPDANKHRSQRKVPNPLDISNNASTENVLPSQASKRDQLLSSAEMTPFNRNAADRRSTDLMRNNGRGSAKYSTAGTAHVFESQNPAASLCLSESSSTSSWNPDAHVNLRLPSNAHRHAPELAGQQVAGNSSTSDAGANNTIIQLVTPKSGLPEEPGSSATKSQEMLLSSASSKKADTSDSRRKSATSSASSSSRSKPTFPSNSSTVRQSGPLQQTVSARKRWQGR